MKKVMIGLFGCCLLALTTAHAQDAAKPAADSTRPAVDTANPSQHSVISRDTASQSVPDTSFRYRGDSAAAAKDTVISLADDVPAQKKDAASSPKPDASKTDVPKTDVPKTDGAQTTAAQTDAPKPDQPQPKDTATKEDRSEETRHELDKRWFISPLLKLQFQDFGMLEKNRKGYLSNANTLPFFQRGNGSFAASAYNNITQRLAVSADLGLSFGHVTSNDVLISQTPSKTYNLLNAALYYHLIGPSYRLQPYVTIGFNDIINDASYLTIPMGIGAKFNSRKIMVLGQITYGYGLTKNNASTTMYSVGIYLPINSKKHKQLDQDDDKPYNRNAKDDDKKKDTTSKNNGNVTNNIYITINMDSVLKAKGLLDDNGKPIVGNRRGEGEEADNAASSMARRKKPFRSLGLNDFNDNDYKVDSLDGKTRHTVRSLFRIQ